MSTGPEIREVTNSRSPLRTGAIAVLSCGLALISAQQSVLAYWRGLAPQEIPGLFAQDAALQVFSNDHLLVQNLAQNALPEAVREQMHSAARGAITSSPLNVIALRQLAILAGPDPTQTSRNKILGVAEGISRRDLGTELALIDAAIASEDLPRVLLHYDRTLRVYQSAQDLLFPALEKASTQGSVQNELVRYAASPWFMSFAGHLLSSPEKRDDLPALVLKVSPRLAPADAEELSTLLLNRQLRDGQYLEAGMWLSRIAPDKPAALSDFAITPATTSHRLGGFAWRFRSDGNATVAISDDRSISVTIDAGRQEQVAERTMALPAGTYEFAARLEVNADQPATQMTWELHCLPTGMNALVWSFTTMPGADEHRPTGRFVLTQACPAQHWTLSALAHDPRTASSIRITEMSLRRVQNDL